MDESEEAGSELIETGGDPSEFLELEEEGFPQDGAPCKATNRRTTDQYYPSLMEYKNPRRGWR